MAGKGAGERSLTRTLYRRLDEEWLLIATGISSTGRTGALRVKAHLTLPVLELLPDASYSSVLVNSKARGKARETLLEAARGGQDLDEDQAAMSG